LFVFLLVLSGVAWGLVYIDAVRIGLRDGTYGIPFFALALNLSWEAVYAVVELTDGSAMQGAINICWALLDLGVVYTYLTYGSRYWPSLLPRSAFLGWSLLVLGTSVVLQLAFLHEFDSPMDTAYSALLQNLVMSVLFISMFVARRGPEGQSLFIAVAKWIGTLAPTIAFGVLAGNVFLLLIGLLCSVFDLLYLSLMVRARRGWSSSSTEREVDVDRGADPVST
jgi:hypothetical protein